MNETALLATIIILIICQTITCSVIYLQQKALFDLKTGHRRMTERLDNKEERLVEVMVGDIDAEIEKSSWITEMRKAKRRTRPRPDAGPPAVVRRMKIHRERPK